MTPDREPYDLEGKNALVTGASKGLGEQISRELVDKGVHVIGTSRSGPPESLQPDIERGAVSYELGDLSAEGDRILERIQEQQGGFEVFVNNAGAFSPDYFSQLESDTIAKEIGLDLETPLLLHHKWLELYNQNHPNGRKPELAVNICSISSFYAWPGGTAYQAAKSGMAAAVAGLRSMERYLATEASPEVKREIGPSADLETRIVAIYPDNVATGLIGRAQESSLYQVRGAALPTELVTDAVMKTIEGAGTFGEYDDVAILVNPKDPKTGRELKGAYLAFIPLDSETSRPDFGARVLEKVADEDSLVQ
jgi:NAD(P)-dependent dehydrogenase (short-subunit alcohol dehydrogenase family)